MRQSLVWICLLAACSSPVSPMDGGTAGGSTGGGSAGGGSAGGGSAGGGSTGGGSAGGAGGGSAGGVGGGSGGGTSTCGGTHLQQFVIQAMQLPFTRNDFAYDLNGDARLDNQLGNIIGALSAQGLDPQSNVDQALALGTQVDLLDLSSSSASFANDPCAIAHAYAGADRSDGGAYAVNPSYDAGTFEGPLLSNTFDSGSPTPGQDVTLTLPLALFSVTPVLLPLHGGHLFLSWDGGTQARGQLNGAMTREAVQRTLIPAVAESMDARVQADPTSTASQQIKAIFDVGDGMGGACTWVDGTTGTAGDGRIASCEVGNSALIQNLFAPDVQLFDDAGVYAPSAANTAKDSVSIGVGFTAVPVTF